MSYCLDPAIKNLKVSILNVAETYKRKPSACAEGPYARADTYATGLRDKPGERIPKAGVFAEVGVGGASAEFSIFDAKARGPYASAGAEASVAGVGAMARAEVGSVSASVGPVQAKLGLGVDTGVSVGADGVELKVLGTGVKIGPTVDVCIFGSCLSFGNK